jgi:DNA-binding transcriptional ArsR family regulator
MQRDEPVTIIDRKVLKVLSAETRMDILKMLSEGARTPSFLSKKLGKSDATIVEHLETLAKVGLVKKTVSPGKKWVFYSLTERGKGIASSKSRKLVIILATSLIALMGGAVSLGKYYVDAGIATRFAQDMAKAPAETLGDAAVAAQHTPIFLYVSITLFIVAIAGFGFYLYKRINIKGVMP